MEYTIRATSEGWVAIFDRFAEICLAASELLVVCLLLIIFLHAQ